MVDEDSCDEVVTKMSMTKLRHHFVMTSPKSVFVVNFVVVDEDTISCKGYYIIYTIIDGEGFTKGDQRLFDLDNFQSPFFAT